MGSVIFPRASASPEASSSSSSADGSKRTQGSLYLFTFLATLLLLVVITSSLIARSFILRARLRNEHVVDLSDLLPPTHRRGHQHDHHHRRKHRRLEIPQLYDAWISPKAMPQVHHSWDAMQPLGVRTIKNPKRRADRAATRARDRVIVSRLQHFSHWETRLRPLPVRDTSVGDMLGGKGAELECRQTVQMTVLVAMPSAQKWEDGAIPDVVIGTARRKVDMESPTREE